MSRSIPFPTVAAPTAVNLSPKLFCGPTIRKCEHGVYVPKGELRAPYCQLCTPGGPQQERAVVLPRSSGDALSNAGRALANKHGSGCPECGSAIYMRVDENGSDTSRECAECGAHYKARLSTHQRALLIEEEAACE